MNEKIKIKKKLAHDVLIERNCAGIPLHSHTGVEGIRDVIFLCEDGGGFWTPFLWSSLLFFF
jgi:hypothetical protein